MLRFRTLINFNLADGFSPNSALIFDSAGDLFGVTGSGGADGDGTVFEIPYVNGSYASTPTTLVSFTNGSRPLGGLTADAAGNLFGTTTGGGVDGDGTVFEIPYVNGSYASTPTTLVSFNGTNGSYAEGSLIFDSAGDLFGATYQGGASSDGAVFEIPYINGSYASTPTTLVSFNGSNGSGPSGELLINAAGDLVGTTWYGGANNDGTVFEIPYVNGGYASEPTTLVNFENTNGRFIQPGLISDAAGDLFGTTAGGGAGLDGSVFEIPYANGSYANSPITLASFDGIDGQSPNAGLQADVAGNLFGTTQYGGTYGFGTTFELVHNGGYDYTIATLVNFNDSNGQLPNSSLLADAASDLFGTTGTGGTNGDGTVFELGPVLLTITGTVARQPVIDGAIIVPLSTVTIADGSVSQTETVTVTLSDSANGILSNFDGGSYNAGVYTVTGAPAAVTSALDGLVFTPTANLAAPGKPVTTTFTIADTDTAAVSVTDSTTTVITIGTAIPALKTLVSFSNTDGSYPSTGLIADAAGDLFGTTDSGGTKGYGTVFEISSSGGGYAGTPTTLVSFNGTDGSQPYANLTTDAAGDLFGSTYAGGANGDGEIFEIPYVNGSYATTPTVLVSFNSTDGANPLADLIVNPAGDLFGTAYGGGANYGTVFEIPYNNGSYASTPTTLVSFNSTDGARPRAGLTFDATGDLFGTASGGGENYGTVFEIPYGNNGYANTPITLVSFNGGIGAFPYGNLITDAAGNLFGTTSSGGTYGRGTVFEIPYVNGAYASTPTILLSFDTTNGGIPWAGLIVDAAGDLFGTTEGGGNLAGIGGNDGSVFEIAKAEDGYASEPTMVASFSGPNGANPYANLLSDASGNLFGTTLQGGTITTGSQNNAGFGSVFEVSDSGFVICYLAGVRIATPTGEVAVEHLVVGDEALTLKGKARRIVWIGSGRALATRGRRGAATPVVVKSGALANNVPHSDLRVTKGHSLYINEVLIPVEFLINHRSIVWDDQAQEVTVYHIELETHDVLIANGAAAESYRDDGNRWMFRNANSGWGLPPQEPCAPVLTGGPLVDEIWRRLLKRAGPRSRLPLTDDADLHLVVDGKRIDALERRDNAFVFRLPARPRKVSIHSRSASPQELGLARDDRSLGVAVRRIVLAQARRKRAIEADDASLADGFHAFEAEVGIRWTNGDAAVPSELFAGVTGPCILMLHLGAATRYLENSCIRQVA